MFSVKSESPKIAKSVKFEYSFLKIYTAAKNMISNLHVSVFWLDIKKGFLRHKHFPNITFSIFSKIEKLKNMDFNFVLEVGKTEIISCRYFLNAKNPFFEKKKGNLQFYENVFSVGQKHMEKQQLQPQVQQCTNRCPGTPLFFRIPDPVLATEKRPGLTFPPELPQIVP